jgi:hypothetical protein
MASQKLPLFGGMIQPVHANLNPTVSLAANPIFSPPDKTSKAPQTFELHLWLLPPLDSGANPQGFEVLVTEDATGRQSAAWAGLLAPNAGKGGQPQKVLDGYPVRGAVTVGLAVAAAADQYPSGPQMWGYYVPVGQGSLREDERRFIGQDNLQKFNEGLGFSLLWNITAPLPPVPAGLAGSPSSAVVHVFEKGRIDEVSLAFAPLLPVPCWAVVTFEKEDNSLVIPGHSVQMYIDTPFANPSAAFGAFPPSPYVINKIPFGGGGQPLLHHIRVAVAFDGNDRALGVHGYFIRK